MPKNIKSVSSWSDTSPNSCESRALRNRWRRPHSLRSAWPWAAGGDVGHQLVIGGLLQGRRRPASLPDAEADEAAPGRDRLGVEVQNLGRGAVQDMARPGRAAVEDRGEHGTARAVTGVDDAGVAVAYDPLLTALSFFVGALGSGLGAGCGDNATPPEEQPDADVVRTHVEVEVGDASVRIFHGSTLVAGAFVADDSPETMTEISSSRVPMAGR